MTRFFKNLWASALLATAVASPAGAQVNVSTGTKPTIVLVHGAFADGSSWLPVIRILEHDGYPVIAVQNPLTSLADDVATTRRVIDAQTGPVVAVGHSYGGAVITGAAAGEERVRALVYVAAFAPDANEPVGAFGERYPNDLGAALRPDAGGFLYIDRTRFHDLFAADLPEADTRLSPRRRSPSPPRSSARPCRWPLGGRSRPGMSSPGRTARSVRSSSASTPSEPMRM